MNFVFKISYFLIIGVLFSFQLPAQSFINGYDSIPISKPKKSSYLYQFNHSAINEIQIKTKRTKRSKYPAGQVLGDIGRGTLTMLFGGIMDVEDTDKVTWKFRGKLLCNDENFNWDINLFCDGESVKLSERTRNEDGTYSIQTHEDKYSNWENDATGIIIDKKDTISKFVIIMDPLNDSILKQRTTEIFSKSDQLYSDKNKSLKEEWLQKQISESSIDYGIIGKFRGKDFAIIADGITRKSWIFKEGELQCMFQTDMDDLFISTEDKVKPYILLDSFIFNEKKQDWFRLAILSKYLSITLCNKTN
ncbi:MAG: hypothetical protein ABFR05_10825 [Bacteroidota bacterium]